MNEHTIVSKFDGVDTFGGLADLGNAILKVIPDIVIKHGDVNTYSVDKNLYPNGVVYNFMVYHNTDLNNHIGKLAIENWHQKAPKFVIQSININDGRNSWGVDGEYKSSIHAKNIVRIAKKVFKPFTFEQIAHRSSQTFTRKIESIGQGLSWELRQNTCHDYQHFLEDWENLYHMGYTPKNDKFKRMMEYVMENKAKIDKYHNYNPNHYFVLVKDDCVQYRLNIAKNEPCITVPNKDALPEDIKGKLFVLDISESKDYVEDVGLKENDGAYWIIA